MADLDSRRCSEPGDWMEVYQCGDRRQAKDKGQGCSDVGKKKIDEMKDLSSWGKIDEIEW